LWEPRLDSLVVVGAEVEAEDVEGSEVEATVVVAVGVTEEIEVATEAVDVAVIGVAVVVTTTEITRYFYVLFRLF